MSRDAAFHEDLMQEALVHLWLREAAHPGQKRSWYLQSCKFHLQHYIDSGRSVDSVKRRGGQIPLLQNEEGDTPLLEHRGIDHSIFSQISARELLSLLSKRLSGRDRAILDCLADGLGAREIARKLKITHPTAIKCRRKIAKLVIELGFASADGAQTSVRINRAGMRGELAPKANRSTRDAATPNGSGLNGHPVNGSSSNGSNLNGSHHPLSRLDDSANGSGSHSALDHSGLNSASLNGSRSKASRRSGSKAVPFLLNPRFRQPKPAKV